MGVRIFFGALIGGALMFAAGAYEHMFLGWVGRQFKAPAEEAKLNAAVETHFEEPGIYYFPYMPPGLNTLSKEEWQKASNEMNEKYKRGPAGLVVIHPTGQDMMGPREFGGEGASNFLAALMASIIVSLLRPDVGFAGRWVTVFLIGVTTWVAVSASYFIWYKFPWLFVQDELLCTMIEWAFAGIAIAFIVRPPGADAHRP